MAHNVYDFARHIGSGDPPGSIGLESKMTVPLGNPFCHSDSVTR
jgi:hypothetical protein